MPSILDLSALLLVLAAGFGVINQRLLKLPQSVGLLIIAFLASAILIVADELVPEFGLRPRAAALIAAADLPHTLLDGALGFLLFAGALQVDLGPLLSRKWTVLALSVGGTVLAAFIAGTGFALLCRMTGQPMPFIWALVLGAILAPTDPVAVIDALRRVGMAKSLEATLVGESLFNDGVGVVLFGLLLGIAAGTGPVPSVIGLSALFLIEALGGALLGLATGFVALLTLRGVDDPRTEFMLSLALVLATYSLAAHLAVSGPIAEVVAGILIGNSAARETAEAPATARITGVWQIIEEILQALLFLLIGLELVAVETSLSNLLPALLMIPLAFLSRAASVVAFVLGLRWRARERWIGLAVLSWGGLRGGIAVALALSLPASPSRAAILAACYAVVLFNIIVQGLTLDPMLRRLKRLEG